MVPMVGNLTVLQFLLNSSEVHLKVKLAKNQLAVEPSRLTLADLTEADFAGYAAVLDPIFSAPEFNEQTYAEAVSQPIVWTVGAIVEPQQITAVYVTAQQGAGAEQLLWVQVLAGQDVMTGEGQVFAKQIRLMAANLST